MGFEPGTFGIQAQSSATELQGSLQITAEILGNNDIQGVLVIRGFVFRGFAIRGFLDGFKSSYFAVYPHNSRVLQRKKNFKKCHFHVSILLLVFIVIK